MEIKFADSFWKSLKTLSIHQTWWYKTYSFFRRDLPYFLENVWYFRKQLWSFRSWDYSFNLEIFSRSLEKTVHTIEFYGNEIDETRFKKVEKMKRSIYLINRIRSENYIDQAELELGKLKNVSWFDGVEDTPEEKEHNRKVFNRATEIEKSEWNELWTILRGQDLEEYKKICESKTPEEMSKNDVWSEWFDGSGLNTWWD